MSEHLEIKEFPSLFALEASLKKDGLNFLFLGSNAENPRKFFSVELPAPLKGRGVGIISSGLGVKPAAKLSKDGKQLLAGHDFYFSIIDLQTFKITFSVSLESVFFSFLPTEEDDFAIILHELGLVKFNFEGNRKWAVHTDVIEDYRLLDTRKIVLKTMESENEIIVDLEAGTILKLASEGK